MKRKEDLEQYNRSLLVRSQLNELQTELDHFEKEFDKVGTKALSHQPKGPELSDDVIDALNKLYEKIAQLKQYIITDIENGLVDPQTKRKVSDFVYDIDCLKKKIQELLEILNNRRSNEAGVNLPGELNKVISVPSTPPPPDSISKPIQISGGSLILAIGALITSINLWRMKRKDKKKEFKV